MATSEGVPSSIDIEFLELNDNPYIPNSVTRIGESAFDGCNSLPNQIKSDIIQRFGEKVFEQVHWDSICNIPIFCFY